MLVAVFQRSIASLEYKTTDIADVNDTYKRIEKDLENESINTIEEKYSCEIILRNQEGYSNELYSAIQDGKIIIDYMEEDILKGKVILPSSLDSLRQVKYQISVAMWILLAILLLLLFWFIFIIDRKIIRPFQRLKTFAHQIAVGNLESPLTMSRYNYFGAFTESFDMMRDELKKARQGEFEANKSKKELVASLSHDIKTPVSTIKALCEILEIKLQDEDAIHKIHTINQKADIIDKLISNMFHATLKELEVLKIEPGEELSTIIPPMFEDINHCGKIHIINKLPSCLIYCDNLRLNQVIDNIINNSYKYAGTDIHVTFGEEDEHISVEIRDYGENVTSLELPLVFEKFYRGGNAAAHSGSGLGLYLAKLFMEGMDGSITCYVDHGFVVMLKIKKA
jgi:signal transduction histidine kinase